MVNNYLLLASSITDIGGITDENFTDYGGFCQNYWEMRYRNGISP
jgi:hypothetical protein